MKKVYVKPMLNASMEGTLEGVYACWWLPACYDPCKGQPKNEGSCNSVPATPLQPACRRGHYEYYCFCGIRIKVWVWD